MFIHNTYTYKCRYEYLYGSRYRVFAQEKLQEAALNRVPGRVRVRLWICRILARGFGMNTLLTAG